MRSPTVAGATAVAPATIGNIAVGFDILGQSIDGPVDRVTVTRVAVPGVRITAIDGEIPGVATIPLDAVHNSAGRALVALVQAAGGEIGFELTLTKGIPLAAGMGGSAASVVAALVAGNALLDAPLERAALYRFARAAEGHGDNVAPALLGGICLSTETDAIRVATDLDLWTAVVHPHFELETRVAREALAGPYTIADFVPQSANLALVLLGLARGERELVAAGLADGLVEPRRAPLIAGFAAVKAAALTHGALGASISGAGPSVFGWFDDRTSAARAGEAMAAAFAAAGHASDIFLSRLNGPRAELVE